MSQAAAMLRATRWWRHTRAGRPQPPRAAVLVGAHLGAVAVVLAAGAVTVHWLRPHEPMPAGLAWAIALLAVGCGSTTLAWIAHRRIDVPLNALDDAMRRIASGDFTRDVDVAAGGDVASIAASANRIRAQVSGYVQHVEASLQRLQSVSRALTTTTGGVDTLQDAVIAAAAATAGAGIGASLLIRRGDDLLLRLPEGSLRTAQLEPALLRRILSGQTIRAGRPGHHLLGVPMLYRERVIGALVTVTEQPVFESDQRALETLASNAAVALENTRVMEQERDAVARLNELGRMKSEFLGAAQHELRTPVLAIQTQLELLTMAWERWDEDARFQALRDIDVSMRLFGDVLDSIVELSLLNADAAVLAFSDVDVAAAAEQALTDVRAHFTRELPVALVCSVEPGAVVRADAARFRRVLRALLDNAVKFTPAGGHVSFRAAMDPASGMCRIDITDDGIGISADALPRVFDRFFQEDNGRTRKYGGMGIGLALVRKLCEVHGATIDVESSPGAGSRFTLTWPAAARIAQGPERWEPLPTLARFPD